MSTPAAYKPLDKSTRQTRFVTIAPSSDSSSTIECSLSTVSMNNPPSYDALSYVWGDPQLRSPIQLEGREFEVTNNLHAALLRLRCDTEFVVCWIDAICINQSDIAEKSVQLLLMGEVYQKADSVRVWLGEESEDAAKAFALLHLMRLAMLEVQRGHHILPPTTVEAAKLFAECTGPVMSNVEYCLALQRVLSREYWGRIWMVQEIGLAKVCILMSGPFSLDLGPLVAANEIWSSFHLPIYLDLVDRDALQVYRELAEANTVLPFMQAIESERIASEGDIEVTATSMLAATAGFHYSVPHDRIYGLLGLRVFHELDLVPDYQSPVAMAYIRLLCQILKEKDDLTWLHHIRGSFFNADSKMGLPSWAPDFRGRTATRWPFRKGSDFYARFNAPQASISVNDRILVAKGAIIDTVVSIHFDEGTKMWSHKYPKHFELVTYWSMLAAEHRRQKGAWPNGLSHVSPFQTFVKTLFAMFDKDELHGFTVALAELLISVAVVEWDKLMEWTSEHYDQTAPEAMPPTVEIARWITGMSDTMSSDDSIAKSFWGSQPQEADLMFPDDHRRPEGFLQGNWEVLRKIFNFSIVETARFFLTRQGYMGMGHASMEPGDSVVLLFGSNAPFIIRPVHDDQFLIVAPCPIYGAMNGEFHRLAVMGQIPQREFRFK